MGWINADLFSHVDFILIERDPTHRGSRDDCHLLFYWLKPRSVARPVVGVTRATSTSAEHFLQGSDQKSVRHGISWFHDHSIQKVKFITKHWSIFFNIMVDGLRSFNTFFKRNIRLTQALLCTLDRLEGLGIFCKQEENDWWTFCTDTQRREFWRVEHFSFRWFKGTCVRDRTSLSEASYITDIDEVSRSSLAHIVVLNDTRHVYASSAHIT